MLVGSNYHHHHSEIGADLSGLTWVPHGNKSKYESPSESGGKEEKFFFSVTSWEHRSFPSWKPWEPQTDNPRMTQHLLANTPSTHTISFSTVSYTLTVRSLQPTSKKGWWTFPRNAREDFTQDYLSGNETKLHKWGASCPTGEPLLFSWSHRSRESLTRNGQLLDLKLQVNCGVLIWFGSSSLKTHGPLQTW